MARSLRFLAFNIVTALGFIALGIGTHVVISNRLQEKARANLRSSTTALTLDISQSVSKSVRSMHGLTARLSVDPSISYETFRELAHQSVDPLTGLIFVEWQPLVTKQNREAFERSVRRQGGLFSDFQLWEPVNGKDGSIPARERDFHVPVLYVYDVMNKASTTLGLDLAFSPERMESKWRARDAGDPVASGLFRVIRYPGDSVQPMGFAVTVPVYRGGIIPGTFSQRNEQIEGFVALVYDLKILLQNELKDLREQGLNLTISQEGMPESRLAVPAGPATGLSAEKRTLIYGTTWIIRLDASKQFIAVQKSAQDDLLPWLVTLMGMIIFVFLFVLQRNVNKLQLARKELIASNALLHRSQEQLKELVVHDPLTNLFNRRGFQERAIPELARSRRYHLPLALLMLDLDNFKQVNDLWGHHIGDVVLQRLGHQLQNSLRATDVVARLGGEEFAILLSHTRLEDALAIAERLRQEVADVVHHSEGPDIEGRVGMPDFQITLSIGCAMAEPGLDLDGLLALADSALYASKAGGRNRVTAVNAPAAPSS
ncbi:diguanylate cyclase [Synechococcus sp. CS-1332]|uniref:sensor domain-containing diguanylate cyclase n=1 Tax=Synechococcus sp. CS-1332 TaxID=2847972 RepID=UPI00223B208D|nr:diguanylate cyclase [Synechococcus sp. CS-1332]MCT0207257.1 diguanylate cyclase [Synechococcus sp. CS-1332]